MFYDFLHPADITHSLYKPSMLAHQVEFIDNDIFDFGLFDIAILGITEVDNYFQIDGLHNVRHQLYSSYSHFPHLKIVDIGNLFLDHDYSNINDISKVLADAFFHNVPVIILGYKQDFTLQQYEAYLSSEQMVTMVNIDSTIDLDLVNPEKNYLNQIFTNSPNILNSYTQLGYQSYLTDQKMIEQLERMNFDQVRLGEIIANMKLIEPYLRNADMLSLDMSAIKSADALSTQKPSPNGFSGQEACQIARFAGLSDTLSSFGIYEYDPKKDEFGQTAMLISQMIWYFIEGFSNRKQESLIGNNDNYYIYEVYLESIDASLHFWKSKKTDRWWMEVPSQWRDRFGNQAHIPCLYEDYLAMTSGEMPERWMRAWSRL
jgi:formiminoglutamase